MLQRVGDWRHRLSECIEENRSRPFEWGQHDCALWAATCVKAITKVDIIPGIIGSYHAPLGASQRLKKKLNANSIEDVCKSLFGDPKHVAFARAGDIIVGTEGMLDRDGKIAKLFGKPLGICNGPRSYFVGETESMIGLIEFDTLKLDSCYHV